MRNPLRFVLLGGLAAALAGPVLAQPGTSPATTTPPTPSAAPPVVTGPGTPGTTATPRADATDRQSDDRQVVDAATLEPGANSFTEGQARARFEDAGFTAVEGLRKDDQGFWRGQAMRNGQATQVALDFRGRIAAGTTLTLGTGTRTDSSSSTSSTVPSTPTPSVTGARPDTTARPDGTPGNPPSTAVGRAVDQMQGQTPRADGTPGNPPGTAAGRAIDRATGGVAPTTPTTPPASR